MKERILLIANLVGFILIITAGWIAWNHFSEKKRSQYSLKEFELRKTIEAGNTDSAKKIIKDLEDSKEFKALSLSYLLHIEKNADLRSVLKDIIDTTKDKQLRALYIERYAYELFKFNQKEEALKELDKISKEDFNYVSAMVLKAQILRSLNKNQEAETLLQALGKDKRETYFDNLAYALLLEGGVNE